MAQIALILFGVFSRLIPHLPNMTALTAVALVTGATQERKTGWMLPLSTLFISDLALAFIYRNQGYALHATQPYVYGSFVLIWALGLTLKNRQKVLPIAFATISSSLLFYLITNFGVWQHPTSFYPHTFEGLIRSYVAGLPFLRNMLLGDLFFSALLFSALNLAKNIKILRVKEAA